MTHKEGIRTNNSPLCSMGLSPDLLSGIAAKFHVSTDYLLGRLETECPSDQTLEYCAIGFMYLIYGGASRDELIKTIESASGENARAFLVEVLNGVLEGMGEYAA